MSENSRFQIMTLEQLPALGTGDSRWLWHGYLARGCLTLLTAQWKAGKTTLLSILLSHFNRSKEFLGQQLRPAQAMILTEESADFWIERGHRLHLDPSVQFVCRPFATKPTFADWQALLDELQQRRASSPFDLLVIDPLASFMPGRSENDASTMLDMLLSLQALKNQSVAVLVLHHPRKGESAAGQAARGSGALCANADITIEFNPVARADADDRRRRLTAYSRFRETPRRLLIELLADASDYQVLNDFFDSVDEANWPVLFGILEVAGVKLTRADILSNWPEDFPKPSGATLYRWLTRAVEKGLMSQDGTGHSCSPFRYWLPGMEEIWEIDPEAPVELPSYFARERFSESPELKILRKKMARKVELLVAQASGSVDCSKSTPPKEPAGENA